MELDLIKFNITEGNHGRWNWMRWRSLPPCLKLPVPYMCTCMCQLLTRYIIALQSFFGSVGVGVDSFYVVDSITIYTIKSNKVLVIEDTTYYVTVLGTDHEYCIGYHSLLYYYMYYSRCQYIQFSIKMALDEVIINEATWEDIVYMLHYQVLLIPSIVLSMPFQGRTIRSHVGGLFFFSKAFFQREYKQSWVLSSRM